MEGKGNRNITCQARVSCGAVVGHVDRNRELLIPIAHRKGMPMMAATIEPSARETEDQDEMNDLSFIRERFDDFYSNAIRISDDARHSHANNG